jgi:hypothetical protein
MASDRSKLLTRDGRSQVEVIEQALAREPVPPAAKEGDQFLEELLVRCAQASKRPFRWKSMADFDAPE